MYDKMQRLTSYVSAAGITVYEIEQYNKKTDKWYIVGDCSTNKDWQEYKILKNNTPIIRKEFLQEVQQA